MRWFVGLIILEALSCGAPLEKITMPPARFTPTEQAWVVPLDMPDWIEICVERFAPADMERYRCESIGELRRQIQTHYAAD